jgi:hypothetical protein
MLKTTLSLAANCHRKTLIATAILSCLLSLSETSWASSILLDGTFQNSIGTGLNLTPWSDWTNAGVARFAAPSGIPGNYASLPVGADLFQRFSGPIPGTYVLSFVAQNLAPWSAELVFSIQEPGGGGWYEYLGVLDLPASTSFISESFTVQITEPEGSASEFYFSNSYDSTTVGAAAYYYPALENSKNPAGTLINVADVSLSEAPLAVPEPSSTLLFASGLSGLGLLQWHRKRKKAVCMRTLLKQRSAD